MGTYQAINNRTEPPRLLCPPEYFRPPLNSLYCLSVYLDRALRLFSICVKAWQPAHL